MAAFQANRIIERDLIFGSKDVALKLAGSNVNFGSTLASGSSTLKEKGMESMPFSSEKERTKNIVKIEREEDFLRLTDEEDESRSEEVKEFEKDEQSQEFVGFTDDLDESGLLEELVACNKGGNNANKIKEYKGASQKPLLMENDAYEVDLNRKIVLFPMIVDLDFIVINIFLFNF